jgi:anaerobic magnesium-protoporphyrin IX monomethyl ester cyclase
MGCDVLLLVPPGINYNTPPLGILYLAAVLEKEGISIQVLDAAIEGFSLDGTFEKIKSLSPRIIGLSVCTPDYRIIDKFAFLLKRQFPDIKIVMGGPHPTLDPEGVLSFPHIDFVIRGEGEYSFLEFCRALLNGDQSNLGNILGLSYKENGRVIHNPDQPRIDDLDELPLAARHLIRLMKYRNYGRVYKRKPVGVMITSRGCPLQCIFCAHEIFGRKYRFMSAARVVEEIKLLQERYGVKEILFREDNFTANRKRVFEFCDILIKERIDITWMCLADANSITEEMAVRMKEAGCWHIGIGVESGNQEIINVLKKNIQLERVEMVFNFLHKVGIKTLAFFMIGNYTDTKETIEETIRFANRLNTDFAIFTITTPFPKTELFDLAVSHGLITNFDLSQVSNNPLMFRQKQPILRTPTLTAKQLNWYQKKAILKFYLRPKQLFRILKNRNLARAFLSIQPESYSPNYKIIREIEQRYKTLAGSN